MTDDQNQDPQLGGATDLYVFGYALIMMELTRRLQTNTVQVNATQAPVNQFCQHTSLPTPEMKDVVRPNLDTLYSQAWLDLSAEPIVLEVPVMDEGRYWLMQLLDAWSNTSEQSPSSITPLTAPAIDPAQDVQVYTYALTGPDWKGELPDGVQQLPFPTNTVWLIGRIELHDDSEQEVQTVVGYQDQMRLLPLSAWPDSGSYLPPAGVYDPDASTAPPSEAITQYSGPEFFHELAALLERTPLDPPDDRTSALLADLGVHPYDEDRLPDAATLDLAKAAGLDAIEHHQGPPPVNGWAFPTTDIGTYGTNYLQRAYVAMTGLGANLPQDALYPSTGNAATDPGGAPIAYTLTFPAGQLPPVDAFWSLTAYDSASFLVANPEDIYAIGHFAAPLADPDTGATTLYVQAAAPADPELRTANWLPIPTSGTFSVTLRLYAPVTADLLPDWPPALTPVAPQD
ncbi:DUF1254 domain-containing protein [Kitasatospora sp. YST-16]|uniref:DUF1254 domain-containing protein n=1 Tax=Kitasatospora sp. YST-16 TaxID=2998080 RepID=UPI0022844C03|nr:DUF1254 domain-containing protein [Kitasatospora sp. YST-16]WAL74743.1 DUF1254 domain-containing protein [Kitasatospora sp. YST-16]WNW40797.1 DUF1254 domain-containing protein [Streptomyces sp. Li-HN-5-13]